MSGTAERVGVRAWSRAGRPHRRLGPARWIAALLLGPAALIVLVLVCYPVAYTIWLSLHNADGTRFVGLDNYATMLSAPQTRRAIANTVIWVVVAPSVVTAVGLIVAVVTERVRRAAALKLIMFMPMAISFLAAGVTFRLVYDEHPDRGALNAAIVTVHDAFSAPSPYYGARPRPEAGLRPSGDGGFDAVVTVPAAPVLIPLAGLPADRVPTGARPARSSDPPDPPHAPGGRESVLTGVVWLDVTRGGGGLVGVVDPTEPGLPGVAIEVWREGTVVGTAATDEAGRFAVAGLPAGRYLLRLSEANFTEPFQGLTWLGPTLITPAVIGAYIWIWAGFAMVLISAALTSLPREAVEAARVDGATEWQILRRVTIPLIRPVLVVVLVTLTINVLKIFDLIYVLAPESSQDDANVVALEMYRVSFGGGLDYGLGSALAVLLFLLVLPAILFHLRRLRRDQR